MSWAQCLFYASKWRAWTSALAALIVAVVFAGAEAALILTLRPIYQRGTEWPVLAVGIVASVLLAIGLLPPYFEIYKRKGQVVGIGNLPLPTIPSHSFPFLPVLSETPRQWC